MKNKITINDWLIGVFFFLISFAKGIGLESGQKIYYLIYVVGLIFGFFKLFKVNFRRKELFSIITLLLIGIFDWIVGKETTILFTAITLLFLKKNDLGKIIKTMFWGRLLGFSLMIILPVIGLMEMNTLEFYRATKGEILNRVAFGYAHPNLAHATFNIIVIMWGYIYFEKIKFKKIIILEIINYILYCFTYSRTGFLILSIFLIAMYISKRSERVRDLLLGNLNIIFIFCICISLICGIGYGKIEIFDKLDEILTGRIRYMSIMINNYIPNLIKVENYKNVLFDNGYYDMIYNGGILASIWFIIMQIKTNNYIKNKKMHKEALLIVIGFVYSLTESYYISSTMNVSLLLFAYILYFEEDKKNVLTEEKK